MNYRPLALMIGALALTPLSTIAAPPPWAGGAKASQNAAGGADISALRRPPNSCTLGRHRYRQWEEGENEDE